MAGRPGENPPDLSKVSAETRLEFGRELAEQVQRKLEKKSKHLEFAEKLEKAAMEGAMQIKERENEERKKKKRKKKHTREKHKVKRARSSSDSSTDKETSSSEDRNEHMHRKKKHKHKRKKSKVQKEQKRVDIAADEHSSE